MTVYIVQEVLSNDRPIIDTSAAEEFGERRVLYRTIGYDNGRARPFHADANHSDEALEAVVSGMSGFQPDDYLLPVGAVKLIAAAAAIAARKSDGLINLLVWDERAKRYDPVSMRLWEKEETAVTRIAREYIEAGGKMTREDTRSPTELVFGEEDSGASSAGFKISVEHNTPDDHVSYALRPGWRLTDAP